MSSDKGGCYAFFATFRPRNGITDDDISRILHYIPKLAMYWLLVIEKEGAERHAHLVLFPHIAQQRSNVVTLLSKHCLAGWDKDEIANFKRWDRRTGTGCVKTATSLDLISSYLDGTYAKKADDFFEVRDEQLPADLHELEKWIPDVGALKRRPNVRFHTLMNQMHEHYKVPLRSEGIPMELHVLARIFYALENHDHREAIVDPRMATSFIKRFYKWYNHVTTDDGICPEHESSIEELVQDACTGI